MSCTYRNIGCRACLGFHRTAWRRYCNAFTFAMNVYSIFQNGTVSKNFLTDFSMLETFMNTCSGKQQIIYWVDWKHFAVAEKLDSRRILGVFQTRVYEFAGFCKTPRFQWNQVNHCSPIACGRMNSTYASLWIMPRLLSHDLHPSFVCVFWVFCVIIFEHIWWP
jgi:hypothetical protein